jgi:hypothetical protein
LLLDRTAGRRAQTGRRTHAGTVFAAVYGRARIRARPRLRILVLQRILRPINKSRCTDYCQHRDGVLLTSRTASGQLHNMEAGDTTHRLNRHISLEGRLLTPSVRTTRKQTETGGKTASKPKLGSRASKGNNGRKSIKSQPVAGRSLLRRCALRRIDERSENR